MRRPTQRITVIHRVVPLEPARLTKIIQQLAEISDIRRVKAIRDEAEAARHLATSAHLSFQKQSKVAELKLRAERRAGQLLRQTLAHGGCRRGSRQSHEARLRDLGIDHNQSARWQREAAVPKRIFERYIRHASKAGRIVSSQALLRLERSLTNNQVYSDGRMCRSARESGDNFLAETVGELKKHQASLATMLAPICDGGSISLTIAERRTISRMLLESSALLSQLTDCDMNRPRMLKCITP